MFEQLKRWAGKILDLINSGMVEDTATVPVEYKVPSKKVAHHGCPNPLTVHVISGTTIFAFEVGVTSPPRFIRRVEKSLLRKINNKMDGEPITRLPFHMHYDHNTRVLSYRCATNEYSREMDCLLTSLFEELVRYNDEDLISGLMQHARATFTCKSKKSGEHVKEKTEILVKYVEDGIITGTEVWSNKNKNKMSSEILSAQLQLLALEDEPYRVNQDNFNTFYIHNTDIETVKSIMDVKGFKLNPNAAQEEPCTSMNPEYDVIYYLDGYLGRVEIS